jgi:hypothetical protein
MSKNILYGSVTNRIAENMMMPKPEIGMGGKVLRLFILEKGGHDKFCHNTTADLAP